MLNSLLNYIFRREKLFVCRIRGALYVVLVANVI